MLPSHMGVPEGQNPELIFLKDTPQQAPKKMI
jgi:hypothetical protein